MLQGFPVLKSIQNLGTFKERNCFGTFFIATRKIFQIYSTLQLLNLQKQNEK